MAKRDEVFPSKYLKASDLGDEPITVTIASATQETLKNPEGKEQSKTVLSFKGGKKTLPLNMVNWDSIAAICGDDTEDWPGHRIELYSSETQMGGKMVPCIRIRAPEQGELPTKKKPAPKPLVHDDMDDAIPNF
jgi:hypothetical protein